MPQRTREYLGRYADAVQYPVACGGLRGNKGSSTVESGNNAIMEAREESFVESFESLAENIKKRFDSNKSAAASYRGELPPRVGVKVHATTVSAEGIPASSVTITGNGHAAMVRTTRDGSNKRHRVVFSAIMNANEESCDKLCSVGTGLPCEHQVAAANVRITV